MPQLTLDLPDSLSVAEIKQISQAIKDLVKQYKPQTEAKKKVKAESLDPIEAEWGHESGGMIDGSSGGIRW